MRYLFNLVIFCALAFSAKGQGNLYSALHSAKSDSDKLNAYEDLFRYYEFSNIDSAIYYLQDGLNTFNASGYTEGRASMLSVMAGLYGEEGLSDLAEKKQEDALALFISIHDSDGIASSNNGLGVAAGRKGDYSTAVQHFLTALKIYETSGNEKGLADTYLKLGTVNDLSRNFELAVSYYQKGLNLALRHADTINLSYIYNNLASLYGKKKDYTNAISYIQKALAVAPSPRYARMRIMPLTNMGNVYNERDQYPQAMDCYTQALALARSEHLSENSIRLMLNIASVIEQKDPAAAEDSLKKALQLAETEGQQHLEAEVLGAMTDLYHDRKDYQKAFETQERQQAVEDSLLNIGKIRQIAEIQSAYEVDRANEKMTAMEVSGRRNISQRNILLALATALALALVSLGYFSMRTNRLNSALRRREQDLEKANKIKDRLFSIIGHDLRSPVASIPGMVDVYMDAGTTDEEKEFMLRELREGAVVSLETLDKLLNWGKSLIKGVTAQQAVIKPNDLLLNELKLLKGNADKKRITITNNIPDTIAVKADPEHFKFLMRNLISNAIKFSYPGQAILVDADTTGRPGFVIFSVTDSGLGISDEMKIHLFEPNHASTPGTANEGGNGIGLMLCLEFVQENGGSIWVKSEKGEGTTFYFSLKTAS